MNTITARQLFEIIKYPEASEKQLMARCEKWVPHLLAAMQLYWIHTPQRQAHFLAQIAHESGRFVFLRELWGPTAQQSRYEGRADLGNTQPGDGFRFRGRGLIQLTGRANYQHCGAGIGMDLISVPEALEQPNVAALASAWWWHANGLNDLADAGNVDHVSDRINRGRITAKVGDSNGYSERKQLTERALVALGVA